MSRQKKFEKLLEPANIGRVKTRNRMIKTAAGMRNNREGVYITERDKAFYEALAKGGIGLIMVGNIGIEHPLGMRNKYGLSINEKSLAGFSELVQGIHKHNCPTFLQILHAGPSYEDSKFSAGLQPVSASSLSKSEMPEPYLDVSRELTIAEIDELVAKFVRVAELACKAGFDGIEIGASTNHLVNSFLSRAWNKRNDIYGCQDLRSRSRFAVEIIQGIKKSLGQDFPVCILINGEEFGIDKGITSEESQGFARILQEAGVDAIQVRAYGLGDYFDIIRPEEIFYPEPPKHLAKNFYGKHHGAGGLVPLSEAIKKVISIPVITVGRIDPKLGEWILQKDKADFIGLTRRLLADPELPNKIAAGRFEDIAPCTGCNYCHGITLARQPVQCRINATLGHEQEYVIKHADKKKKVIIVGGGPAGMEAARVAALRGHEVFLYDKAHMLGGLLPLAALVKGFEIENLEELIKYLRIQITKLGVKVRLGKEVNLALIEELKPDVIIIATGGLTTLPEIPGIDNPIVISNAYLHKKLKFLVRFVGPKVIRYLTKFWMPLGKRVTIIGCAIQGCELAEFLIKRGRKVTMIDTGETVGDGLSNRRKIRLSNWLTKHDVNIMTQIKYDEIIDKGITVFTKEGKKLTLQADNIVIATALSPNTELSKVLEGNVPETYAIGDCKDPQLIKDAIESGFKVAYKI